MSALHQIIADDRLCTLYQYWQGKRAGRAMLTRADIDPVEIPRLLPHIILIEVAEGGRRFRFRLVGTAIIQAAGTELTARYLDEVLPDPDYKAHVLSLYRTLMETRRPVYSESEYMSPAGRMDYLCSRLLLPLSSDGGDDIEMVLCGKVFSALPRRQPGRPAAPMPPRRMVVLEEPVEGAAALTA
jgi:hypothetical protein